MDSRIARSILKDRRVAFLVTDRDLNVIQVGDAANLIALDRQTVLHRPLPEVIPELIGAEPVLIDILNGDLPRFELTWINRETAEGETMYLTMVTTPCGCDGDEIIGLLHTMEDVTATGIINQQLAQQRNELRLLKDQLAHQNIELAAANAELQRLDEIKSVFISVAAHELRTPLTSINGYLEMLLEDDFGPLTDAQRNSLTIARRSTKRLATLSKNLLDVTRIEADQIELKLQPTDLATLLQTIVAEYQPQFKERQQQIVLDIDAGLPSALCDGMRVMQIFSNLLNNASKYTPQEGHITVRLSTTANGQFLQAAVADTGVGIPREDHEKIFERFFRAGTASQTRATGAGLGLHVTRSLVELHGGHIWFESEPDQGSTFYVTFPIAGNEFTPAV